MSFLAWSGVCVAETGKQPSIPWAKHKGNPHSFLNKEVPILIMPILRRYFFLNRYVQKKKKDTNHWKDSTWDPWLQDEAKALEMAYLPWDSRLLNCTQSIVYYMSKYNIVYYMPHQSKHFYGLKHRQKQAEQLTVRWYRFTHRYKIILSFFP